MKRRRQILEQRHLSRKNHRAAGGTCFSRCVLGVIQRYRPSQLRDQPGCNLCEQAKSELGLVSSGFVGAVFSVWGFAGDELDPVRMVFSVCCAPAC